MSESSVVDQLRSEIYCSFFIGQSEFALAVERVQEVVNPPTTLDTMPLAPTYLLGIFNLRGTLIPVIDLRDLLKLAPSDRPFDQSKIVIMKCGTVVIGLLTDSISEVFKGQIEDKSTFDMTDGQNFIAGAFKLNEGRRIIQILNSESIVRLENLPRTRDDSLGNLAAAQKRKGLRHQCISFLVGTTRCGLPIDSIREILKAREIQETVMNSEYSLGHIELRGSVVPIINFSSVLNFSSATTVEAPPTCSSTTESSFHENPDRILVFKLGDELFGLLVQSVESIISYFDEELLQSPVLNDQKPDMFAGCITRAGADDVILLDHRQILSDEEIRKITRGHSNLYKAIPENSEKKKVNGSRRTYITFLLDSLYGFLINEIQEIIELPPKLLQPPGMPKSCEGVLNLRGELVTIVNTRKMYGLPVSSEKSSPKVLIFVRDGQRFGLIVDRVESIVKVAESDKMKLPDILYSAVAGNSCEDIQEAVQIKSSPAETGDQITTLLVMNLNAIFSRVAQLRQAS